ncbi:MAG: helix-turn-helix domain-containing protein [Rhodospirillales bacterium]|nr:MAG: helix-turn-helix domain-containing protein [Rhodospirillales bacterium]
MRRALAEAAGDMRLYDEARAGAAADAETWPLDLAKALRAPGTSRVRAMRDHRGMTQAALAAAAGLSTLYVSQIETGRRAGSARTRAALAAALRCDPDLLRHPAPKARRKAA